MLLGGGGGGGGRYFLSFKKISELVVYTDVSESSTYLLVLVNSLFSKSKKGGKDKDSIQSSTTPDPGYHMGK